MVDINTYMRRWKGTAKHLLAAPLGALSDATRMISAKVRLGALSGMLGASGRVNTHGQSVQKMDLFADDMFFRVLQSCDSVAAFGSEENPEVRTFVRKYDGCYVVNVDPLDGSSNINTGVTIGSIFSVLPWPVDTSSTPNQAVLQNGRNVSSGERVSRLRYNDLKEAVRGIWESMRFESGGKGLVLLLSPAE